MRKLSVSTDVFAAIWKARGHEENSEDAILKRILGLTSAEVFPSIDGEALAPVAQTTGEQKQHSGKIRWVDDVVQALRNLGGKAHLHKIYLEVKRLRELGGRTIPFSTEEVIRKELEVHSSDSEAFGGREDLFTIADKGSGVWALR